MKFDADKLLKCPKCGVEYPATREYWLARKNDKEDIKSYSCRACLREYNRSKQQESREKRGITPPKTEGYSNTVFANAYNDTLSELSYDYPLADLEYIIGTFLKRVIPFSYYIGSYLEIFNQHYGANKFHGVEPRLLINQLLETKHLTVKRS